MEKGQEYAELIDSLVKSSESGKDVSKDVDDVKTKLIELTINKDFSFR